MRRATLLTVIVFGTLVPLAAQTLTGRLVGTATDPDGLPVPGVVVHVVKDDTGFAPPDTETDSQGGYAVPGLPVGTYSITVESPGFRTDQRRVTIEVGRSQRVNFSLVIGAGETIEVVAPSPLLQTDSAQISTVMRARAITALPNNGGDFVKLAQAAGGVVTAAPGSELENRGGFNAAGMDENTNSFFTDGFDNNDPGVRNVSFRPPLDTIEEYTIVQSTYNAEFGRNAGAVINLVTRSGTNDWHGSLAEDLRNDNLDALNFFAPSDLPEPDLIRNQFAATVGGPIVENRTFIFAGYEGIREKRGEVHRATVPTTLMRTGDFSELLPAIQLMNPYTGFTVPYSGNIIPQSDWDPTGIGPAVLNDFPDPNTTGQGPFGISGNRIEIANHIQNADTFTLRGDHALLENTQLLARFSISNVDTIDPFRTDTGGASQLSGFGQTNDITSTNAVIGLSTAFGSSLLHEFRVGYNRFRQEQIPLTSLPAEQQPVAGYVKNYLSFVFSDASTIGSGGLFSRVANVFNYIDQWSWQIPGHQLKTGVDVRRYQFNAGSARPNTFVFLGYMTGTPSPTAPPPGLIPASGLADLLLGFPVVTVSSDGDPEGHSRKTEIGAYVQDDWRVTPSLTLTYGIRWEWYGRITETDDKQSTWDAMCDCMLLAGVDTSRQLVKDDWNNFAPRFGFAWRPFGDASTVIRGGGGIYYDSEQRHNYFQIANTPFFDTLQYQALGLMMADPFPSPGPSAPLSPAALEQDMRDTYFEHWSLSVQEPLGPDTMVELAYIGNHGVGLQRNRDVNYSPYPGIPRPYLNWGPIRYSEQAASSIYHSFQARLERRFSDRLGFLGTYTWGHSIDDRPGQGAASVRSFQNHFDPGADRADSDFDVRHRATVSLMYDLPTTRYDGPLGQVLNGWALNSIITLQSGRPFTVYMAGSNIRPDRVMGEDPGVQDPGPDNWIDAAAFTPPSGLYGDVGRNTLRGPGLQTVDLAAVKGFEVGENRLEFRTEFFNLLNHPNFGLPNPDFTSPAFGTISATVTPGREIQFGLRYGF
jgi:Carboxypeptidase regulatory-like domain/TonB dependent receptor-like, beta-barrel